MKQFENANKQFVKVIRRYLKGQRNRVIENLDNRVKALEDEVFNLELEIKIAKDEFLPFLQDLLVSAGQGAILFVGGDQDFNLSATLVTTLEKRADLFTRSISEKTFEQLKNAFSESFAEGENRSQLNRRIRKLYNDISDKRAEVISRTEVQVATQTGIFGGYNQAGIGIKVWTWVIGVKGGIRDNHLAMDGEEQPINSAFSNGLMYPGEPTGPAEEVINCQCTL